MCNLWCVLLIFHFREKPFGEKMLYESRAKMHKKVFFFTMVLQIESISIDIWT